MDEQFTVHRTGGAAVTADRIVAVGPEALTFTRTRDGRLPRPRLDAGTDQRAHARADVAAARSRRRPPLDVWLMGYMMPVEREFVSPDFVVSAHA
jgi:hypothetical protein